MTDDPQVFHKTGIKELNDTKMITERFSLK